MSIKLLEKITRNIFIQNALNTSIFNVKKTNFKYHSNYKTLNVFHKHNYCRTKIKVFHQKMYITK